MSPEFDALRAENARLRRWLMSSVTERLEEYLCGLATRRDDQGRLVVIRPPSQEAMAAAIFAGREHVNRSMNRLRRAKLVEQRGFGRDRRWIALSIKLEEEVLARRGVVGAVGRAAEVSP